MTRWTEFGRDDVHALAPDAIDAFRRLIAAAGTAYDCDALEIIRRRIGTLLSLPSDVLPALGAPPDAQRAELAAWPTSPAFSDVDRVTLGFAEQFVLDVAGVSVADRQRLSDAIGASTFGFVQAVYVLDQVARLSAVTRQLFGGSPLDGDLPTAAGELWPAMEAMMAAVIAIRGLDPLTAELVRLRGARVHNCRVCQSRRRVTAVVDDAALLEEPNAIDAARVDDAQRAALLLTDAILLTPGALPPAVINSVRVNLTPQVGLEVAMLVAHNAANKIAVALGADAPVIATGIEFFEIDAAGGYDYGLPSPV